MDDPNAQKQRVKHLARFDQDSWKDRVDVLLKAGLIAKFTQNDHLKAELLSTADTVLGEACAHDTLFGIGLSLHNPNAMDPARWRGQNLQGTTLMRVRDEIKN